MGRKRATEKLTNRWRKQTERVSPYVLRWNRHLPHKGNLMRVLMCGDRDWTNVETIKSWVAKLQDWGYDTVIEGAARAQIL